MDQHRKAALEIIHEYYYALPNNGYLNHGLLSCDKRYKEATQCALIGVKRIILILEFMSTESNDPAIMGRINFYDKVQDELYKTQANNHKMKLNELPTSSEYEINEDEAVAYFERAEKINKAREYSSPLIEELINETTPEEFAKIDMEMETNETITFGNPPHGMRWDEYGNPVPLIGETNNTLSTINMWALRQGVTMYIDDLDSYGTQAQVNTATDVLWDFVKYVEAMGVSVDDEDEIEDEQ